MRATSRTDVFKINPIFDRNTLGSANNIEKTNGFTGRGLEAQAKDTFYGEGGGLSEYGKRVDTCSFYATANAAHDGRWRYRSPSPLIRLPSAEPKIGGIS